MLTDSEWEDIRYDLVETGFFDYEARLKTLKGVRRVLDNMSPFEIETLRERISITFAPAPGMHGEIYPFADPPRTDSPQKTVMVYLSPEIERHNQTYVDSLVAHEFAHVLLHRFDSPSPPSIEREADSKVKHWGFKPAYRAEGYPESREKSTLHTLRGDRSARRWCRLPIGQKNI